MSRGAEEAAVGGKATVSAAKTAGGVSKAAGGTKRFLIGSSADEELKQRVEKVFKRNPGINPDNVEVRAEEGTVTLTFTGGSSAEWNRAVVVAKRIDGVERVQVRKP